MPQKPVASYVWQQMDDAKPEVAAEKAIQPDRLLPGEARDTRLLEDAEHWLAVYTELVQGKQSMVAATRQTIDAMSRNDARREVESTDMVVLARELDRFRRGMDFWKARIYELQG
ncbi:MAG TPA: hypothetical protein VIT43_09525 [Candidatus Dormibacteraeota bacterium]